MAIVSIATSPMPNQSSWVAAMPSSMPSPLVPASSWGSRLSMMRPMPPMAPTAGRRSWSPRWPESTRKTCAARNIKTYPTARPSGPGSSWPWSAMFVIAKPSGTRTRIGSSSRSSTPRQVTRIRRGPSPVQPHPHAADGQLVAEAERHRPIDAVAVDVRAVRAALVLDEPRAAAEREHRVVRADEVVLDEDRVVHVAADGVDRPERQRRPDRWLVLGRLEHREPPDPRAGGDLRLLRVPEVP